MKLSLFLFTSFLISITTRSEAEAQRYLNYEYNKFHRYSSLLQTIITSELTDLRGSNEENVAEQKFTPRNSNLLESSYKRKFLEVPVCAFELTTEFFDDKFIVLNVKVLAPCYWC